MTCLGGALAWVTVFSLGGAWSPTTAQGRLVLAGVAVAALCAALTRLTVILVEAQAQSVLNWLAGSLANVGAAQVQLLWPCTLIGGLWANLSNDRCSFVMVTNKRWDWIEEKLK